MYNNSLILLLLFLQIIDQQITVGTNIVLYDYSGYLSRARARLLFIVDGDINTTISSILVGDYSGNFY